MSDSMTGSSENVDEQMLKKLFDQCDAEIRTGHVKSVDLIAAIQVRSKKLGNCACPTGVAIIYLYGCLNLNDPIQGELLSLHDRPFRIQAFLQTCSHRFS